MNAKEAREITNKKMLENDTIKKIYQDAQDWILWAANQGKCYIAFEQAVPVQSINLKLIIKYMLKRDGFEILPHTQLGAFFDETDYIVW